MTTLTSFELSSLVGRLSQPQGFGDATLRSPRKDAIELLGGIPDPAVLPTAELAAATERVLSRPGVPALQYSRTEGIEVLREWIAAREGVPAEQIIITNGGFHGLSLAVQTLLDPGDLVAVDNPIFPLFLRGLELATTKILPVSVDAQGLDVDELEVRLVAGARPKALYTVPDFHNPTQGSLPEARRAKLVSLAERFGFVILADNPYRELYFEHPASDHSTFNSSSHVVHVNTFTKTLGPGLRLGWLVAPQWLVPSISALRSRQDSHSSTLVQALVADALTENPDLFDSTLQQARALYRTRAQVLAASLNQHANGKLEVLAPQGGLFLWPRLVDDAVDASKLAQDARALGVDYQQGSFFPSGPGTTADRHLRLSYGHIAEDRLEEAAKRLGEALRRQV